MDCSDCIVNIGKEIDNKKIYLNYDAMNTELECVLCLLMLTRLWGNIKNFMLSPKRYSIWSKEPIYRITKIYC